MDKNEKSCWIKMLDLYKNLPHLWDKRNGNYHNKTLRHESFLKLLEVYKDIDKEATVDSLKMKINNMRTCFCRELKKVKSTTQTGSSAQDVYVPTLWYYDSMMFLSETSEPSLNASDTINEAPDMKELLLNFELNESEETQDVNSVPKKKQRHCTTKKQENLITPSEELLIKKEDKFDILAKYFAIQLQDIEDEQLTIVNKIISEAIFYAKIGKLTVAISYKSGGAGGGGGGRGGVCPGKRRRRRGQYY